MICQFKYLCLSFLNQFKLEGNHVLSLKNISSRSNYMKVIMLPNLEGTSGEVLTPSLDDQQIAIWEKVMLKVSGHAAQVSLWVNTHLSIKRIWIICCKAFHRLVLGKIAPSLPPPSPSSLHKLETFRSFSSILPLSDAPRPTRQAHINHCWMGFKLWPEIISRRKTGGLAHSCVLHGDPPTRSASSVASYRAALLPLLPLLQILFSH